MVRYLLGGVALGLLLSGVGVAPAAEAGNNKRRPCAESCQLDTFSCVQACNAPDAKRAYETCANECQERGRACTQRCSQDNRY